MRFKTLFLAVFLLVTLGPSAASADTASSVVKSFQTGLIEVMKNAETLGVSGRYEKLLPIVKDSFNLPLMAALSAGKHWRPASTEQKKRLVAAFQRMSVATLATLFDGYSGQEFKIKSEKTGKQRVTFVNTELTSPGSDKVRISYVVRNSGGRWRMIDVVIDGGISELKVRISEYRKTLKDGGIEALIALLNGKADSLLP